MILNFDLHAHSRFSADGVAEPEEMIAEGRRKGLHGFAITDHNTSECVDYLIGKGLMRADGLPVDGFLVIPGQEITTADGHLLALGVSMPDNLKGITPAKAVELIHAKGGLAIPPHPFDFFRAGIRESVLDTLPIDAVEVFNAATTLKRHNTQAFEYAQRRGLPMIASSDSHDSIVLGTAYTIVDAKEFTLAAVLKAITTGSKLNQRYLAPKDAFKKTWNNVLRLGKKKQPAH